MNLVIISRKVNFCFIVQFGACIKYNNNCIVILIQTNLKKTQGFGSVNGKK